MFKRLNKPLNYVDFDLKFNLSNYCKIGKKYGILTFSLKQFMFEFCNFSNWAFLLSSNFVEYINRKYKCTSTL